MRENHDLSGAWEVAGTQTDPQLLLTRQFFLIVTQSVFKEGWPKAGWLISIAYSISKGWGLLAGRGWRRYRNHPPTFLARRNIGVKGLGRITKIPKLLLCLGLHNRSASLNDNSLGCFRIRVIRAIIRICIDP